VTTAALIRTTYLNADLRRAEASVAPWTDVQATQAITDALNGLWQDGIGKFVQGTAATSQASDVYTVPAIFAMPDGRISRIELEQTSGGVSGRIQKVTSWQRYSDTQVRINPGLPTSSALQLRFFGWIPFQSDGSDLPVRLERMVSMKAAALCYGQLSGQLANSQIQQGLDSGRVVDYATAVGLSSYWERRYRDLVDGDQSKMSYAPRHAHR
jgi:hypothetical protein